MEFGVRELIQFATLLASLAGAFAVVKSQLSRVIEDLAKLSRELEELGRRLDRVEASDAVFESKIEVLGEISSVRALEIRNREYASMLERVKSLELETSRLHTMHNTSHPILPKGST